MLKLNTGTVRVTIERDGEMAGEIKFNPDDVDFVEHYYAMGTNFAVKQAEYTQRAQALDEKKDGPAVGLALLREMCDYMREEIDGLFGAGTSSIAFGDARSLDAIRQFISGITPYIRDARAKRLQQYVGNDNNLPVMQ